MLCPRTVLWFTTLVLWGVVASPEGRVLPVSSWAGSPERAVCRGLQRVLPWWWVASKGAADRAACPKHRGPTLEGGEVGRNLPEGSGLVRNSYSCWAGLSGNAVVVEMGINPQEHLRRLWARCCCLGWFSAVPVAPLRLALPLSLRESPRCSLMHGYLGVDLRVICIFSFTDKLKLQQVQWDCRYSS